MHTGQKLQFYRFSHFLNSFSELLILELLLGGKSLLQNAKTNVETLIEVFVQQAGTKGTADQEGGCQTSFLCPALGAWQGFSKFKTQRIPEIPVGLGKNPCWGSVLWEHVCCKSPFVNLGLFLSMDCLDGQRSSPGAE